MNWQRLFGQLGGKVRSQRQEQAARENLAQAPRRYALSSPDALLRSLDEEQRVPLAALFKQTRSAAHPFNGGNTNAEGNLPSTQIYYAKRRLRRLDLPEEVAVAAGRFLEQFVWKGMGVEPGCDIQPDNMRVIGSQRGKQ